MADLSDVFAAIKTQVLMALYPPSGVVPGSGVSIVAGAQISVGSGWPAPGNLDAIAASLSATPQQSLVSVFAPPGMWRNTTRYPLEWETQVTANTTVTATVSGQTVTIGGTISTPQNVAILVKTALLPLTPFVYSVQPTDTPLSIAAALATIINAQTPASAAGAGITIPAAVEVIARVGGQGTVIKEVMRQTERVHLNFWCPSPQMRDAVSSPVKAALAGIEFLTLADQTAARLITCGDYLDDGTEKAGIYRRCILYDVEYATTVTMPAYQIVVPEVADQAGSTALGTPGTVDFFF